MDRLILLAVLMAGLWASCGPAQPDGQGGGSGNSNDNSAGGQTLTGELVFFSGRPPPEWSISETEQAEIAARLEGLTSTNEPASFPRFGPVGYRIVNSSGIAGIPDGVLVQEGVVEVKNGDAYSYFLDDRQLEAFLQASSKAAGAYAELGLDENANPEGN